ncbi:zinc finger protein 93 [Drosophila albomicans]|uniref:Zinc finger protein 93 n=1 Tax=Drosophila albomicans TaxID=7291 RepID=A0A6P8XY54_DROAB|nr:zinc finger protein 93 [Drosophila albomicans]
MRTLLSGNNCLTCLHPMETGSEGTNMNAELQELLQRHLDWQPDELSCELLPQRLCNACHQLLLSYEQFQQQARNSRQQLLAMLQSQRENKQQTASFEIVYEEHKTDDLMLDKTALETEDDNAAAAADNAPQPDPFDEPPAAPEQVQQRRYKGLKNSFKCQQCGHCFAHNLTLQAHIRKVHEGSKRPFQCDRCDKCYSFMGGLYTHIKEIHGSQKRSYPCDYPGCERIYISCIAMQKHKRLKHSASLPPGAARKYVCEQCGATFNQTANLKYHRRTKHPTAAEAAANARDSERHFCELCQKHFHSRYTLKYHNMQQHAAASSDPDELQQLHECQVCGRRMAKRFMLVQHMLMHSNDKMPCEHCGRLFARKFELEAHIRAVHLKLKPFDCKYCAESFASRKTLRHHEYIHTGEKPYVCQVCGQAFRQQTCLKNHGKVHDKLLNK